MFISFQINLISEQNTVNKDRYLTRISAHRNSDLEKLII